MAQTLNSEWSSGKCRSSMDRHSQVSNLDYRTTGLQGLQDYRTTGLQDYRTTGLQDYRTTGLQDYRTTGLQDYRATGLQDYRTTGLQDYRTLTVGQTTMLC